MTCFMSLKAITFWMMSPRSVKLESVDPATGELLQSYSPLPDDELQSKIRWAEKLWMDWRFQFSAKRADLLDSLAETLIKEKEKLSLSITREMGKPLNQSVQEIEKCVLLCRYYREHAEPFLSPRRETLSYKKSYVHYAPLGGVLGIMPWNFPFWQVFRFAVPALSAGNVVFLKHSENVTGCALALENVFINSGWPAGTFNTLLLDRTRVERVIGDPFIRRVSFTGSTGTGRHIASLCGQNLKRSVLELGGSDPYIILEDADLSRAAQAVVSSRFNNSGQSCIAAKRVIVERSVYEDFSRLVLNILENKTIFNPLYNPDVGPVAKKEFAEELKMLRDRTLEEGGRLLYEKGPPSEDGEKGFYFPITVVGDCHSSMTVAYREVFGPLLTLFPVSNGQEALETANRTKYGLGAAVFTENRDRGEKWARDYLSAGSCYVNEPVKSHPGLPFGGVGDSGYGRELSVEGILEFVNIKTVALG